MNEEKELIALFEKADGDKNKQLSKGKSIVISQGFLLSKAYLAFCCISKQVVLYKL